MAVSFNGLYTQDFDTLASSGASNSWTNDSTIVGWWLFNQFNTAITAYAAGDGSSSTGSFYSFGTSATTDRALGGLGSGGAYFGSPGTGTVAGWIAFSATNNTGSTINNLSVNFNGEQWRNGGNTTAQSMVLQYGFGTSFTTVASWITPGSTFNWTSPFATASAAAIVGNVAGQFPNIGGTLNSLNWATNDTLWLRWIENNDTGNDHGLAIDDFSISASIPPSMPTVNLSVSSNTGTEAGTTVITVTATASSAVSIDQTVSLGVSGTGITAGDYNLSNTTITIPNGQTTGTVTFTVVDDALVEGTETATLTISNPTPGITLGTTTTQNITITDNDFPTVNLSVSSTSGTEAGTTIITVTATASSAVSGNQTVSLGVTGTDITAGDYYLSKSTITIANGQTSGTVSFIVADDAVVEGTETATLTISNPSSGVSLGTTISQDITITNNGDSFLTKVGGATSANGAEIPAFDPGSDRVFVVAGTTVEIYTVSNTGSLTAVGSLTPTITPPTGTTLIPNSVAVKNGVVAVAYAVQNTTTSAQGTGKVAFFDATTGNFINAVDVGALPDMLTFTPDGTKVLVANEGEPNSYGQPNSVDPEGSVSIIDIAGGVASATVQTATFTSFNSQIATLKAAGVRIFGPGSTVAQDLEPEYIAVAPDGLTARITLQENNAVAILDIATATITQILPLGVKDYSVAGNGIDASDQDGGINIQNWPVVGLYQPDAIASFVVGGQTYYITANEGDSRNYTGFNEEIRVGNAGYVLDPTVFPNGAILKQNANLGRLQLTNATGDTDGDNDIDRIESFGARSFSIWNASGTQVFDSGDQLEQITATKAPTLFNSDGTAATFDSRSDNKGPEPEGVVVGVVNGRAHAFIGSERTGDIFVYDVSNPTQPVFVQYINTPEDVAIEGLTFVSTADSPTGKPLLITANEVSKTVAIFEINEINEAPTAVSLNNQITAIAENTSTVSRIKVADIAITDEGQGTNTLSLTGADASSFEIISSALYLKAGTNLDFETKSSYAVTVNVDDTTVGNTPDASTNFTLTLTDVKEAATDLGLSANTITENTIIGSGIKIGDITITDPDANGNNNVLSVQGTDEANFEIRNGTELYFKGTSPDFETKPIYNINLTSTDGGLTYSKAFTVDVLDLSEITGGSGNDNLIGTNGANESPEDEYMDGGAGNDTFYGLSGNDTLIGGAGTNTANYIYATSGVNVNLTTGVGQDGQGGTDTLIQIQNVTGSNFNDLLTGDGNANTLNGRDGHDTIYGLAGNDILIGEKGNNVLNGGDGIDTAEYKAAPNGVVVNLLTGQATTNGYGGADTLSSIETVSGSDKGNDKITGDNFANNLLGNGGNDTLIGLGDNDRLDGGTGADSMVGGTGDDSYSVDNAGDKILENTNEGSDTVLSTVNYVLGSNLETLSLKGTALNGTGNALDNSIIGNASNNLLNGGAGNDRMDGDAGNDTLTGGSGRDDLTGGLGSDRFDFRTLGDSLLGNNPDIIRDFNVTDDKFRVSTAPTVFTQAGAVTALTQAGISAKLTLANTGDAAQFSFGTRTFVAINDSTAGFQLTTDAVIELTTSGLVGTLATSNFVV